MATNSEIFQEIRRLHERLNDIEGQLREMRRENSSDLVPLQALADELDVARSTIYRRLEEKEIPIRTADGAPKGKGDRSAAYVSRSEWEGEEELHTQTVRHQDGQYE